MLAPTSAPATEEDGRGFAILSITGDAKRAQVFYDAHLATRHWSPYMDVVEALEDAQGYQTALILKKRTAGPCRG